MRVTVLITGFGPFAGVPFNPSGPLAQELAQRRHPAFANVRRISHVFRVCYEDVDCELAALLQRERPDALVMFGLAVRTSHIRIETRARNALGRTLPDVAGRLPRSGTIVPGGPAILPLRAPSQRLLMAARSAGLPAALSHDAGHYLCNFLCWRAAEAAKRGATRMASFIHVPHINRASSRPLARHAFSLDSLLDSGEAILRTMVTAARARG
jgi:pyroglutamyl-peptidase